MKIKTKKAKNFLGKLPWFLAEHAFLTCLVLFFVSLIFGTLLFYKYNILAQRVKPGELSQSFLLKEDVYQEVLNVWQKEEEKFQEADFREYPNPFQD
ncbi:MAG: hypothetical protein COU42_03105 [Candidatus Nealsonbacteria bacterium CG10_big_fil_rev_8_21_14_0_10_36_24]|uniref:Uncharacterized protein n=2 Tax=Candidatus Nealsoniibacteriota TaxID=1817911 RepID=A0A2H0YNZ9_9BACT|nr:MAG: hypothetical protein COU42_03105 [Candidatus Nealsonbacteria bacterium CG10_big_fil_rev_8_21_14_0_10_36_24]PIS40190.1 MAG: hypothetical protein COT32_01070 [Candidatus Nealsonbacteria bacterium CG08_land_8_20_14_0_20_36_22]